MIEPWIQTYIGKKFWPLNPKIEDVNIEDIAHALSMKCRYNGHCDRFYSVAEHSVYVSNLVLDVDALWGLMHDASEAYLPDVVRPIKPYIQGFEEIENRLMNIILRRFGLPVLMPNGVKEMDDKILYPEKRQVMKDGPGWDRDNFGGLGLLGEEVYINCWNPGEAEGRFLDRFIALTK